MAVYEMIDNISMSIAGVVTRDEKYFSKEARGRKISEWFDLIKLDIPIIDGENYYPVNVQYEDDNKEAAFRVEQWMGEQYPTIIYHHGAAEGSYDFSFNRILAKDKANIRANLIAIQALFNHNNKEFMESISSLSNYTLMLGASVMMVENIIKQIREISTQKILVTGTSLGGFVTNLHFTYYSTADLYKPLLSGVRVGDVFTTSAYSKVTSSNGINNSDKLRHALNFEEDFHKRDQKNLFPLMGEYDQIIKYDVQSLDYNEEQITIIPFGHATGATKFKILRNHIVEGLY